MPEKPKETQKNRWVFSVMFGFWKNEQRKKAIAHFEKAIAFLAFLEKQKRTVILGYACEASIYNGFRARLIFQKPTITERFF